MKSIAEDSLRLLVRVLAATDAVFWPVRRAEWEHPRPAAIYAARQSFRRGVIVSSPGTAAERKSAERLTDALIQAGLLKARRRGRGRFLRLMDAAEDRLRQRCGLPGLWLSYETVRRIRESWTPETELNDGRGWGDGRSRELAFVELLMLPSLVRGYAESCSTIRGHVYYRRMADPPEWPEPTEELPEPSEELGALYHQEAAAARERILAADAGALEIGLLPRAMGMA